MGTPALRVTGINHVVLHVQDLERSVRFYKEVLGFEGRRADAGSTMSFLRCGDQGLDLFEVAGETHGGEEMNHMALSVAGSDLDAVVEALTRAGVETSAPTPRRTVFIRDPDGHRIEVLPARRGQPVASREATAAST